MARGKAVALDDVSKGIIEQLQEDGRRSYAAIGKVVGLSEAAVRQRVQRLIDGGVMQVVAVTDPLELGFARQAMVGVRVTGRLEPVADAIAEIQEVDYVVITAGSFDLLVEVVAEQTFALDRDALVRSFCASRIARALPTRVRWRRTPRSRDRARRTSRPPSRRRTPR